jgi:hypothetical protein
VEVVSSNFELKPIHPEQSPSTPSTAPSGDEDVDILERWSQEPPTPSTAPSGDEDVDILERWSQEPPTPSTAPSGDTGNGGCGCSSVFWIMIWAYILLFMVAKFIGS